MKDRKRREYQLALLSGKKTLLKVKEPILKFVRRTVIQHIEECADLEKVVYIPKLVTTEEDKLRKLTESDAPLSGNDWYNADLYGKRAVEPPSKPSEGNVVLGFSTSCNLILDIDYQAEDIVLEFAKEYSKFHDLGSSVVLKTSDKYRTDLFGNKLGKYCAVFGKYIDWEEIRWHIKEARRLGMIERTVVIMTRFGDITERANAKNKDTPPPKLIKFFPNNHGDMHGIRDYVSYLNRNKELGF
jgi:hypothetical protein